jgi:hypothetical protein
LGLPASGDAYRRPAAEREYTSLTTYLNDAGALVVMDAEGTLRDGAVDVTEELGRLRGLGWQLVDVDTSETVVEDGGVQTVLISHLHNARTGVGAP